MPAPPFFFFFFLTKYPYCPYDPLGKEEIKDSEMLYALVSVDLGWDGVG